MATKNFPQRNNVMPMNPDAVAAARAKLDPGKVAPVMDVPSGNGSRREVRKGEWVDDRKIIIGAKPTASPHSPPPLPELKELPASYDPAMVYQIQLGSPVPYLGRLLSPGRSYKMTGDVCADAKIQPAIVDAVEIGPVPNPPDAGPTKKKA
jgi:hypothetical protein